MRIALLALAASLVFATSGVAQTTGANGWSTAPTDITAAKKKKKRMPGTGAEAGPNNSTGNMNTKGAGRGTTGTGGRGGSGNR
jgi:hypothetical protein